MFTQAKEKICIKLSYLHNLGTVIYNLGQCLKDSFQRLGIETYKGGDFKSKPVGTSLFSSK